MDQAHRKQALEIVEQMKTVNRAYAKQREKSVTALAQLEATRETLVAELKRAGQPLIAEDRASAEQLLVLRFQLKSVLTASERANVLPAPTTTAAREVESLSCVRSALAGVVSSLS